MCVGGGSGGGGGGQEFGLNVPAHQSLQLHYKQYNGSFNVLRHWDIHFLYSKTYIHYRLVSKNEQTYREEVASK